MKDVNSLSNVIDSMIYETKFRSMVQSHAIERSKIYSLTNIMDNWEVIINDLYNKATMDKQTIIIGEGKATTLNKRASFYLAA